MCLMKEIKKMNLLQNTLLTKQMTLVESVIETEYNENKN